jgi:hypothetical protein
MAPTLDPITGYLPPGVHQVPWGFLQRHFGGNSHRAHLLDGLERALKNLAAAGCRRALIDGSFVSAKQLPGDFDAAWEPAGVDPDKVDPVLLDMSNKRAAMKAKYGGEMFPASAMAAPGVTFRDFFQRDRSGVAKGVLEIDLATL